MIAGRLPIEVKRSVAKTLFALVGCAAFTALGAWGLSTHSDSRQDFWIGVLCIGFFGVGGLVILVSLFDRRPRILLDTGGIWVRGWKGCPIEWSDIERVWKYEQKIANGYSQVEVDYVCLSVRNSDDLRSKQGRIAAYIARYARSMGMGDVYFATKGMDAGADELVAAIQSHIGGEQLSPVDSVLPFEQQSLQ